jgi:hypothetical protein
MKNELEIQKIVEEAVSQADARRAYLSIFADACVEADITNGGNWAVTDASDAIRLQVGHYVVFTIQKQRAWLALDRRLIDTRREVEVDFSKPFEDMWVADTGKNPGDYPQYLDKYNEPFSINGSYYFRDKEAHQKIWPHLRRLHFELFYQISHCGQPIQSPTKNNHNPAILDFLYTELSRSIPNPRYPNEI